MSLIDYKLITAGIIALITLSSGFASLHFIKQHQRFLQIGDALADGIFLGVAVFHLLPYTLHGLLIPFNIFPAIVFSFLAAAGGFILIFFLERWVMHQAIHVWILAGVLSIHALITGAALGVSDTITGIIVLFIAISAHKAFESFALAMGLHRRWEHRLQTKIILACFTFMTPVGIVIAAYVERSLASTTASLLTSIFSAFAAGTFLYIGTLHASHNHFEPYIDTRRRYYKWLVTGLGIAVMAVLSIWV